MKEQERKKVLLEATSRIREEYIEEALNEHVLDITKVKLKQ